MSGPLRLPGPAGAELAPILGESRSIRDAVALAQRVARSKMPILLVGATGTGKELLARHIHAWSERRGALVDVNCGALPRDLVEGMMFGQRRGSFTGAEDHEGLIEAADGGTLFLDELLSLPLESQPKLLRALDTGEVRRVGETRKRPVDFRVVAAAHEDVHGHVGCGALRRDLYYRLAAVEIVLPPLRARPEDVEALARYVAGLHGRALAPGTIPLLRAQAWPGNVRELRAVIEHAVWLSDERSLSVESLARALVRGPEATPVVSIAGQEAGDARTWLVTLCRACRGDRRLIAAALGMSQATMYRRLKALGIELRRFSGSRHSHDGAEKHENFSPPKLGVL